jgi:hypothetical protein
VYNSPIRFPELRLTVPDSSEIEILSATTEHHVLNARDEDEHMAGPKTKVFSIEALREFSTRVFLHFGVTEKDAAQAADVRRPAGH